MEPKIPAPNLGAERAPGGYSRNLEQIPSLPNPETRIERAPERLEQRSETSSPATSVQPILPAPVAVPAPLVDDTSGISPVDDTPLVANDDDLIEREWVDKAKKIIVLTKDDPYRREQEVVKLQADYLRKRYGRELGTSE